MKQKKNNRPVWVGLFILIGTSFFVAVILLLGNINQTFKTKMEVFTEFENVNGLKKGDNIWFSGVKIGTINEVEILDHSKVLVTLNIDIETRQFIKKDALAKVASDGLLGNRIIEIVGGSAETPAVEKGDTLGVYVSTSTEEVVDMLQQNNKNLLTITSDLKIVTNQLAQGEGSLGMLLHDKTLYNNLNRASYSLNSALGEAKSLLDELNTITENMNKEGTLVNKLTSDTLLFDAISASVLKMNGVADTASIFIDQLHSAAQDTTSTIGLLLQDGTSGKEVGEIIKNLESSSQKLDENLEALQHNFLLRRYFRNKD